MKTLDIITLSDRRINISKSLRNLYQQAESECNRKVVISTAPKKQLVDYEGRTEWCNDDVQILINAELDNQTAAYIIAHELGHAIQFARGYPILIGNKATSTIARHISDFLLDSSADSIAVQYGFPIATGFECYFKSKEILSIIKTLKNGRSQGNNWIKIWEYIEKRIMCEVLRNKLPRIPRDLQTLWVALTNANIIQRSTNLGLTLGNQMLNDINRIPLLHDVIMDLLKISTPGGLCSIEQSLNKYKRVIEYLKAKPNYLSIYKPLADEIYINNRWQQIPKQERVTGFRIQDLFKGLQT